MWLTTKLSNAVLKSKVLYFKTQLGNRYKNNADIYTREASDVAEGGNFSPLSASIGEGEILRQRCLKANAGLLADASNARFLIHVPSLESSPAGYYLFTNWIQGLNYLGIPALGVPVGEDVSTIFEEFKPTFFFTSDDRKYIDTINWDYVKRYRSSRRMVLAMTATPKEGYNTEDSVRIKFARNVGVDFFVSFRNKDTYLTNLVKWLDEGYEILEIPFSANPIWQRVIECQYKKIDFTYLASVNWQKVDRYISHVLPLARKHNGFIYGPGWGFGENLKFSVQPYIYSMTKVGINLHIGNQLGANTEINERTFVLACCGCLQVCDEAGALRRFFTEKAVPCAIGAKEYRDLVSHYINNEVERRGIIKTALEEVYEGNTIFDRMKLLISTVKRFESGELQ